MIETASFFGLDVAHYSIGIDINTTRCTQLVVILPQGLLVRYLIQAGKTGKPLEGDTVQQHVLQLFITQPIQHPQQLGTEDDKLFPGTATRTGCTWRTEDIFKDWLEKVALVHLNAPDLHRKVIINCLMQVNHYKHQ